ncbi:hypothetical protein HMPREF0999_04351, partial [Parabacteroides sp. D25]
MIMYPFIILYNSAMITCLTPFLIVTVSPLLTTDLISSSTS